MVALCGISDIVEDGLLCFITGKSVLSLSRSAEDGILARSLFGKLFFELLFEEDLDPYDTLGDNTPSVLSNSSAEPRNGEGAGEVMLEVEPHPE